MSLLNFGWDDDLGGKYLGPHEALRSEKGPFLYRISELGRWDG